MLFNFNHVIEIFFIQILTKYLYFDEFNIIEFYYFLSLNGIL